VRPGWALEIQARRAKVGRKKVKRTRRHGDGPASVKAKRIGCAATAAPRARACGPKDNLLRPGHDDPKTRRTRTSSPFEGRRQSANVPQRLAIAGPGPDEGASSDFHRDSMRNAFAQHKEDDECPDMRLRDETILDRRGPPTRRSNHVSKGADDALTPRIAKQVVHRRPDASWQADSPWSVWRTAAAEPPRRIFERRCPWVKAPLTRAH